MTTAFVRAAVRRELRSLLIFDRKVFPSDHFPPEAWLQYEVYWLMVDARKIGCCAFEKDVDFQSDLYPERDNPKLARSVYISTTGILPAFQRMGFGQLFKAWQIAWARRNGFLRIVTNMRRRNAAMIALNRKFGFRIIRTTPDYYDDPPDATVVMELDARAS